MKQKKRIEIEDFTINENSLCDICYNCKPSKVLSDSIGFDYAKFPYRINDKDCYEIEMPDSIYYINGISLFRQHFPDSGDDVYRLLIHGSDKKLYLHQMLQNSKAVHWLYQLTFEKTPITLAYKKDDMDAIIITDGEQMKIWVTNYSPYTIEDVPIITDMCINEGVLYCCLKEPAFKIWYATDLNPENVGGTNNYCGYISLEDSLGFANRVLTLDENVYVIRDYGISKISYVSKSFSVSEIYSTNTKIYPQTACVCGNLLIFMTNEGLFTYNGVKVTKTDLDLNKYMENGMLVAASLGSKYYLACRLKLPSIYNASTTESYINNALVVFDTNDSSYQIIKGVDIKTLLPVKTNGFEKMLILFNSRSITSIGEIVNAPIAYGAPLTRFWLSKPLFKDYDTKLITKLTVNAKSGVDFKLMFDNKDLTFTTYKDGLNEFSFKVPSKQLKIIISSKADSAEVYKVYVDYYDY